MLPAVRAALPRLLADPEDDVAIAACNLAKRDGDRTLVSPLLDVVSRTKEKWLFDTACHAAKVLGARTALLRAVARRLHEPEATVFAIDHLASVVEWHSWGGGTVVPDDRARLEERWLTFITANEAALEGGERFSPGDPRLPRDLFPQGMRFTTLDGGLWP
jgi:hypothetical protein